MGCQSPAFKWAGQGTKAHVHVQMQACHSIVTTATGRQRVEALEHLPQSPPFVEEETGSVG